MKSKDILERVTIETSKPQGVFDDDWQAVKFYCSLSLDGCEFWAGIYRMGIGHFTPSEKEDGRLAKGGDWPMTNDQANMYWSWMAKPHAQYKDKQLQADVAALIAKQRKISPEVEGVLGTLLSDGSAHFDHLDFSEWCDDIGYNDDSIKDRKVYDTCCDIGRAIAKAFTTEEIESLREWAGEL